MIEIKFSSGNKDFNWKIRSKIAAKKRFQESRGRMKNLALKQHKTEYSVKSSATRRSSSIQSVLQHEFNSLLVSNALLNVRVFAQFALTTCIMKTTLIRF